MTKLIFNNNVYSKGYFDEIEKIEAESVPHIAEWICGRIQPKRILDVGCGPGHMMLALQQHGCHVFGVDISPQALAKVAAKGLRAEPHDLTNPEGHFPGIPYDLVITCEVAEHLEARYAELFVRKLAEASDVIYMTAAEPAPGGIGSISHVNEQPNDYWIDLLKHHGFDLDLGATDDARTALGCRPVVKYLARPMIFRRRSEVVSLTMPTTL